MTLRSQPLHRPRGTPWVPQGTTRWFPGLARPRAQWGRARRERRSRHPAQADVDTRRPARAHGSARCPPAQPGAALIWSRLFTWKLDSTDASRTAGHANYRITLDMYVRHPRPRPPSHPEI